MGGLALGVPDRIQIVRTSGLPLYETTARRRIIARRRVVAVRIPQLIAVSLRVFRCAYKQHPQNSHTPGCSHGCCQAVREERHELRMCERAITRRAAVGRCLDSGSCWRSP